VDDNLREKVQGVSSLFSLTDRVALIVDVDKKLISVDKKSLFGGQPIVDFALRLSKNSLVHFPFGVVKATP
jgi:hypothetical protein